MLQSIKYQQSKAPRLGIKTKYHIVLRDTCFGELRFKKIVNAQLEPYLVYLIMKTYSQKNVNPIPNIYKYLLRLYKDKDIDLYFVIAEADVLIRRLTPSINFYQYLPLFNKVYIPKILG